MSPQRNDRRNRPGRSLSAPPEHIERPELPDGPPPALAQGGLRVYALGGIGEVGRNMTVFEYEGRLLIVDCGVLFPSDSEPGIDLILPDFRTIEDRLDDIDALVLTHGHEDHIGAVPWLLRMRPDIPVVGSRFTLALVAAKCKEHRLTPHLQEIREGDRVSHGGWDCEYFAVNHSIPDAVAVAVRTPAGLLLHTGDIKLDQLPLDGRLTDLGGFSRLGEEGVDLFLVDSHQRRGAGLRHPRGRHRAGHLRPGPPGAVAHHPGLLRQPRAPCPAGARRRAGPRPQGVPDRTVHGPQHGPGRRPLAAEHSAGAARRHRRGDAPARREAGARLHRIAG